MDRLVQWTLILLAVFGINLIAHADNSDVNSPKKPTVLFEGESARCF